MTSKNVPYDGIKRALDICGSIGALVFLSPLILATAVAVRIKLGAPVLFKQERPGVNGKIFKLYKFRSMLDVDEKNSIITNEQRMTKFGRWLRATSLDELPSLLNVAKGEMSIVGPRPLRVEYLPLYSPVQNRRHEVRPGITGMAQARGRNGLSWEQKFELDVEYVSHRSALLDARIILETIISVIRRDGIEGERASTTNAFVGSYPTDGLKEEKLDEKWLSTRVEWLKNPKIREGITIEFDPDLEKTKSWYSQIKSASNRRDWVYIDENEKPIAMAGLLGVGSVEVELYIYVDPNNLGRGYGLSVLRRVILNARSLGAHRLTLEVKENNTAAIRLYEKSNFIFTNQFVKNNVTKRKYSLSLKG